MASTFIYNETMTWTIDWINKDFTTLNNIEKIEEVYLWGVAYRDISFVWNVITFADAPPIGASAPTIDYFVESVASPSVIWDVTFGDIIDEVYDVIWETRKTTWPFKESIVKRWINKWIKRLKNKRVYKNRILSYTFNKSKDTPVTAYDANELNIWVQDYVPANWLVMLWDSSVVRYTTYIAWALNWLAWYVYESGEKVSIGYKIPEWVKRPAEVLLNGVPLIYMDNREWRVGWNDQHYTIVEDSLWERYIFLPYRTSTKDIVTVKYTPVFGLFVDDADIVDIEYEYTEVISRYTAYIMLMDREDDRWQSVRESYKESEAEYRVYKWKEVDWINTKIRAGSLQVI